MKWRLVIIVAACIFMLAACSSNDGEDLLSQTFEFEGEIIEITDKIATVKVTKGDILKSANQVFVDISKDGKDTLQVGDHIKVVYDGEVMESYPAQIHTISVEKLSHE